MSDTRLELWLPIDGWPYEASSLGNIRRIGKGAALAGAVRKRPGVSRHGYRNVVLSRGPKTAKSFMVHNLIAAVFLGPKPTGMTVNHIDGNSLNNAASNLEYITSRENTQHAAALGLMPRGEAQHAHVLTESLVRAARELRRSRGWGYRRIARELAVPERPVYWLLRGKTWRHVA